jgi:urease accessory protein
MARRFVLALLLMPQRALAHSAIETDVASHIAPILAGMIHPILHPTHLLAAITVGVLAAVSGGSARWAYPASSFGAVVLGAVIGFSAPLSHPVVAALGLAVGLAVLSLLARSALVGFCAALALLGAGHGYIHGLETRALGSPLFGVGVLAVIVLLQSNGFVLGFALGTLRPAIIRAVAALTLLTGLMVVVA